MKHKNWDYFKLPIAQERIDAFRSFIQDLELDSPDGPKDISQKLRDIIIPKDWDGDPGYTVDFRDIVEKEMGYYLSNYGPDGFHWITYDKWPNNLLTTEVEASYYIGQIRFKQDDFDKGYLDISTDKGLEILVSIITCIYVVMDCTGCCNGIEEVTYTSRGMIFKGYVNYHS